MSVSTRSVADALRAIVGPERLASEGQAAAAAVDGRAPRWVARPSTAEQTAALLAVAGEEKLAVVPRGSGSGLGLGRPPARLDLVLDLRSLDTIVQYEPADLTVSVLAGVTAGALAARLAPHRQWLPVDPPGAADRTLGGMVATNASGPLRARYGTLRDLLLGVRFVQAAGVVTWGGARVVKSVTGYDVPKLMVGALGTLGVLTELTLRLHPVPEASATTVVTFARPEAAQEFLALLLDSTLEPNRVEFLNEPALRACGFPPSAAAVAVSVGSVEAAVQAQERMIEDLAGRVGGEAAGVSDAFWSRHDAAMRLTTSGVVLKVGTLTSRIAETVRVVDTLVQAATPVGKAVIGGQGSVGVLRVGLPAMPASAGAGVVEGLRSVVARFDGGVVIERGPRELRTSVDPWGPVPAPALALMRGLKDEFDPTGVLNPGRFAGGL
jgi:glycolate oxidase FAD binding subunit